MRKIIYVLVVVSIAIVNTVFTIRNSDEIVEQQMKVADGQGFDAKDGEWVSMFDKGIIDPTNK